jgi:GTPase SAR1 family protein
LTINALRRTNQNHYQDLLVYSLSHFSFAIFTMAEASTVPTFKLVLVGDGGTGKVSIEGRLPAIISLVNNTISVA